jgi:hypothetical protein
LTSFPNDLTSSSHYDRWGGGTLQIAIVPVCHCEERWRRGNLLKSAPIMGIAASLSLLAMTAKGFAGASPVIMRTAVI